ncbi:MAG: orotidine-5'-phosphate decarboxylase, partial [Actinobacteria bacterium]|nr:orotidine-5'-phosphate decarboxylase [Actinomycetota bacterium]
WRQPSFALPFVCAKAAAGRPFPLQLKEHDMTNFADRLLEAVDRKRSHVAHILDPDPALLPPDLWRKFVAGPWGRDAPSADASAAPRQDLVLGRADDDLGTAVACVREFVLTLLARLAPVAAAVKPQLAYFEALGPAGYALYAEVVGVAQELGLPVIADAKRGDIGSTAEAYARAHLDLIGADAITVNPWMGSDSVAPFLSRADDGGKGVFVLVKTSNPGSADLQDLQLAQGGTVYEHTAALVRGWGLGAVGASGYSAVGAVVGGTHPAQATALRDALPGVLFLVPGYGAHLAGVFDRRGTGAVVNSSRGILYAYRGRGGDWVEAAVAEAENMRAALWRAAGRD